jgi:hypothetical protein
MKMYRLDSDNEGPIMIQAATDRAAKSAALRRLGRTYGTFRPGPAPGLRPIQGWNLGRHEGCATAALAEITGGGR